MAGEELVEFGVKVRRADFGRVAQALSAMDLAEFAILYPHVPQEPSVAVTKTPKRRLNPKLVTVLANPPGLAVITLHDLGKVDQSEKSGYPRRVFTGITHQKNPDLHDFMHFADDEARTPVGILAQRAIVLQRDLVRNHSRYVGISEATAVFFTKFCRVLYQKEE